MPKLTAKEIREACPGASAEFVLGQVEACESDENRGIEHVLKAHNAELAAQVQTANATAAAAQAAAEAAQTRQAPGTAPGVSPVGADGAGDDPQADPITAWNDAVSAQEKRGKNRQAAVIAAVRENPQVHAAFVRAHNESFRRPAGRFDN